MTNSIVNIAIRSVQLIFAAIVCGLSVDLARGNKLGSLPVTLGFAAFVGCVSLLAAFVGFASTWIEILQGKIGLIIDGFIMVVNLAGGLLIAINLKGIKCDKGDDENQLKMLYNSLMNGGRFGSELWQCAYCLDPETLESRCKKNQADTAFMFLTVIVILVSLTMAYLRMKKGY